MTQRDESVFDGYAGRQLVVKGKPRMASGPYVRLTIAGQNIYFVPPAARAVAASILWHAAAVEGKIES